MFKRLRVSYWLIASFLKKHAPIILLSLPLGILAYFGILKLSPYIPQPKPYHRIGRVGRFNLANLPLDIQNQLSSGLTALTPQGIATPSLALNWHISDDGKTYTFQLDPQKNWHNGKPIKAQDITYTIQDVDVSSPNDQTIQFKLKEAYAPFPTIVSQPVFYRPKKLSLSLFSRRSQLLGAGKFHVVNLKSQGQYIQTLLIESAAEKIRYTFYPTEEAAILGFKLGEVDILTDITDPKDLKTWPRLTLDQNLHQNRYVAVFFNTQDANLADKNLRQALTYAIPQKPSGNTRALSPFNPNSWAYNPQVKPYLTNLKTARELLQKSQQESGSDTLPEIELLTTLSYLSLADAIKANWESLGIKTQVKVITHPPDTFQALLVAHQIPPDPDQYTLWHSSQPTNLTRYQSPKLDKLLEDGRQTLDQEKRKEIYQDFQRFLVEDSPAAFLFYQTTYTISRK